MEPSHEEQGTVFPIALWVPSMEPSNEEEEEEGDRGGAGRTQDDTGVNEMAVVWNLLQTRANGPNCRVHCVWSGCRCRAKEEEEAR